MIISASRRTDIPAFYSGWFVNRLREGYVLVPNPYDSRMLGRVKLTPGVADCTVFRTKNPHPMLDKLEALRSYPYYFQHTLNPYGKEIETNLPPLENRIETFGRLSDKIEREKSRLAVQPRLYVPGIQRRESYFSSNATAHQRYGACPW